MLIGTGDITDPGRSSRHFEGAADFQLLTTDGFQRALHLFDHIQIRRRDQTVDSLHVLMEFGESRFSCFEIVRHSRVNQP